MPDTEAERPNFCTDEWRVIQSDPNLIKIRGGSIDALVLLGAEVFLRLDGEVGDDELRRKRLASQMKRGFMMRGSGWYGVSFKEKHRLSDEENSHPTLTIQLVNGRGDKESQEEMKDLVNELLKNIKNPT